MPINKFELNGKVYSNRRDYEKASHDLEIIKKIKASASWNKPEELRRIKKSIESGKPVFYSAYREEFLEELEQRIKQQTLDLLVRKEVKRKERRRKRITALCSVGAILSLGYCVLYAQFDQRTSDTNKELSEMKKKPAAVKTEEKQGPLFTLDQPGEEKEVLEEYKNLLKVNKKLIGWVKIDDTKIDYPVMQTGDNSYYLDHNLKQEYDKNGSIFMDKDCDVLKPSCNFIIYGHHMRSGNMFGTLDMYEKESYYKEHPYIQFDTIYEKGIYQVMYVFRSRVYKEDEIVFKYYQFIDANGATEFDSYMREMADVALYDTGVTAAYGDQLLTLSTCDYQETNGRFVVVAKKISKE